MLKTEPNVDHSKMLKSGENMYNIIRAKGAFKYYVIKEVGGLAK